MFKNKIDYYMLFEFLAPLNVNKGLTVMRDASCLPFHTACHKVEKHCAWACQAVLFQGQSVRGYLCTKVSLTHWINSIQIWHLTWWIDLRLTWSFAWRTNWNINERYVPEILNIFCFGVHLSNCYFYPMTVSFYLKVTKPSVIFCLIVTHLFKII